MAHHYSIPSLHGLETSQGHVRASKETLGAILHAVCIATPAYHDSFACLWPAQKNLAGGFHAAHSFDLQARPHTLHD